MCIRDSCHTSDHLSLVSITISWTVPFDILVVSKKTEEDTYYNRNENWERKPSDLVARLTRNEE